MKIYAIVDQLGGGMTWAFRPTKKEAQAYVLERIDGYDKDDLHEVSLPEITEYQVQSGREGMANALNNFIEWTCLNEH